MRAVAEAALDGAARPNRTWAAAHLRGLRDQHTGEIAGRLSHQARPGH